MQKSGILTPLSLSTSQMKNLNWLLLPLKKLETLSYETKHEDDYVPCFYLMKTLSNRENISLLPKKKSTKMITKNLKKISILPLKD